MSSPGGTDLGLLQPVALLYLKRHGKMSKLVTKGLNYESQIKKKSPGYEMLPGGSADWMLNNA